MAHILVTGMSGTGKSSALAALADRGYAVVETDAEPLLRATATHEIITTAPLAEVVEDLVQIAEWAVGLPDRP